MNAKKAKKLRREVDCAQRTKHVRVNATGEIVTMGWRAELKAMKKQAKGKSLYGGILYKVNSGGI
jgi:hypothetical protein